LVDVKLKQNIWDSEIRNTSASEKGEWSLDEIIRAELVNLRSRSDETIEDALIPISRLSRRVGIIGAGNDQDELGEIVWKATMKWQAGSIEFYTKWRLDSVYHDGKWTLEPGHKANLSSWTTNGGGTVSANLKLLEEPLQSWGWGDNDKLDLVFSGGVIGDPSQQYTRTVEQNVTYTVEGTSGPNERKITL
jgi:hypothetical protein